MKSFSKLPVSCPTYDYGVARPNCYVKKLTVIKVPRICQPKTVTTTPVVPPVITIPSTFLVYFKISDGKIGTPAIGASTYILATLVGKSVNDFSIWRNGTFLYPIDDYTFDSSIGMISFTNPFNDLETFLIR